MRLVIEISDGLYNNLDEIKNGSIASKIILNCVRKGQILPKGHGRLVDAEILDLENLYRENDDGSFSLVYTKSEFPTIIEADKE